MGHKDVTVRANLGAEIDDAGRQLSGPAHCQCRKRHCNNGVEPRLLVSRIPVSGWRAVRRRRSQGQPPSQAARRQGPGSWTSSAPEGPAAAASRVRRRVRPAAGCWSWRPSCPARGRTAPPSRRQVRTRSVAGTWSGRNAVQSSSRSRGCSCQHLATVPAGAGGASGGGQEVRRPGRSLRPHVISDTWR